MKNIKSKDLTLIFRTDTSSAIKIADIVITDDALGTNDLTLAGADAASFEIVGFELRLKAGTTLDFETKASFDVTVQVDDAAIPGSPDDTALHTLNITDVNDTPTTSGIANVTVDEDAADSVVDLFAAFADVEDLDPALTYMITNNTNPGLFTSTTIDGVAGSLTLNYAADQNGAANITVRATDTGGQFVESTFTVTVNAVNDTPAAANDTINATEDTVYNDTLPAATDADGDAVTYALETAAANGTAVVNADGSFCYTSDLNSNAPDSFTYTVSDGNGGSNTYTVSINVAAVNDAPSATSSAVTAATENAAYSYTITTSDVDGDVLTITAPALPAWLTLVDNGDGTATLSGTPTNADVGDHIVELQIFDGALIDIQDFTVTVSGETTDDGDSDLRGSTNPDPELFENPESDDELDPGVETPIPEDQPQDPVIEDEPAPPVEESLTPQAAADGDAQLVDMQNPEIEENEEIIDLTDEIDPDSLAENHGYDSSYIFFDNDLYKEIQATDYLALDYTAFDGPIPIIEEGFTILDLDDDDANRVDLNENYDLHRQEIDESFNTEQKSQRMRANIVSITAASFAAGFVSYLLRAGSLVANLMSTLPLWRGFDPIVIFSGDKKKKKNRKDIPETNEAKSETLFDDKAE